MSEVTDPQASGRGEATDEPVSLTPAAARRLATTTKSPPQMQGISPRWLLRLLPWVPVSAGVFRVNRRRSLAVEGGVLGFTLVGGRAKVPAHQLRKVGALADLADDDALEELAARFVQRDLRAGELLCEAGAGDEVLTLVVEGKLEKLARGRFGDAAEAGLLGDGDHLGEEALGAARAWPLTVRALTDTIVLELPRAALAEAAREHSSIGAHLESRRTRPRPRLDKEGQREIAMVAGHSGEAEVPGSFVDYETRPREYELSVAQTILRVHTRVADLYNDPMDQVQQQLRLTLEAIRERQERELLLDPGFGLLHNVHPRQRLQARTGPPTPDDLDELLCRRRKPTLLLAHPRAIAAFHRECNRASVIAPTTTLHGSTVVTWRGVPLVPCDKLPITREQTTSILVLRTGLDEQGVVGLHQPGIPEEVEPSINMRFMGISEHAVISYLVTAYFSAAVLLPDALGVLDNVTLGR